MIRPPDAALRGPHEKTSRRRALRPGTRRRGRDPAVAAAPSPTGADTTTGTAPATSLTGIVNDTVGAVAETLSGLTAKNSGAVNFAGTVSLSNCSGSVVRMPNSAASDPALVLTNGHCLESGFPRPARSSPTRRRAAPSAC